VAEKHEPEGDIVRELQEDAEWSMWTNPVERWRGPARGSASHDPGVRTFMLAAILVAGAVVGAIGLVVLLFKLS
jgi:hypothetical protein